MSGGIPFRCFVPEWSKFLAGNDPTTLDAEEPGAISSPWSEAWSLSADKANRMIVAQARPRFLGMSLWLRGGFFQVSTESGEKVVLSQVTQSKPIKSIRHKYERKALKFYESFAL